jgi:hypothetical protein
MTEERKVLDRSLAVTLNPHLHLLLQLMRLFLLTHLLTGIKCNTTDKIQHILYSNTNWQSWVELVNPTFLLHILRFYRSIIQFLVLWIWHCYCFYSILVKLVSVGSVYINLIGYNLKILLYHLIFNIPAVFYIHYALMCMIWT